MSTNSPSIQKTQGVLYKTRWAISAPCFVLVLEKPDDIDEGQLDSELREEDLLGMLPTMADALSSFIEQLLPEQKFRLFTFRPNDNEENDDSVTNFVRQSLYDLLASINYIRSRTWYVVYVLAIFQNGKEG